MRQRKIGRKVDVLLWAHQEMERIKGQHHGFGWCPDCQEWRHCAGEHDAELRHEDKPGAHICEECGGKLESEAKQ